MLHGSALNGVQNHNNAKNKHLFKQNHDINILGGSRGTEKKAMATHSSTLAWKIPGTGEPVGCRLWGHTESDTTDVT